MKSFLQAERTLGPLKTKINLNCTEIFISHRAVNTHNYVSVVKTGQLMLYREIIAVCSEIHTKHVNILVHNFAVYKPCVI